MTIRELIAAGIEIQGDIKVVKTGERQTTWKANSVFSLFDSSVNPCDSEIKYIYQEDGSVVFEIAEED